MRLLHLCSLVAISLFAVSTSAQEAFDWTLLKGRWAESANHSFACRSDNLHNTFVVSRDRRSLTFKLDRKWKIGTGQEVTEFTAEIKEAQGRLLVIKYGPELEGLTEPMREWEMLFIGPGVYRWRATAWPAGSYNNVIGVKCAEQ